MAFKTDKIAFKKLNKLPITKRVSVAQSNPSMLAELTPTQFAELFPLYYRRVLPDVGGFRQAISQAAAEKQAAASASMWDRLADVEKRGAAYAGEVYHKLKRKLGLELPTLSNEQAAAFQKLQAGGMLVDSAEGKMFAGLSDKQLASLGISKGKDATGHDIFNYSAPEVSKEEAIGRLQTAGSSDHPKGKDGWKMVYDAAKRMGDKFPEVTAAQWAHESAWGSRPSGKNNVFGQKAGAGEEGTVVGTHENYGAGSVSIKDKFKDYNSIDDAIADHIRRWSSKYKNASNAQEAVQILKNSGYATDPDYVRLVMNYVNKNDSYLAEAKSVAAKPEGTNGQYSDEQITTMMGQLRDEKNAARKQQLANLLVDAGVPTATVSSLDSVQSGGVVGGHFGESKQCVALSKHFAPSIGPASSWQFHDGVGGIVPGAVIATQSYKDGSGGRMAKDMPDGRSHYHTGVALTKPDVDGNVLILDQAVGHGSKITKINIYNYNGERWGAVKGGEPSEKSMQAVNIALERASESEKNAINESMRGGAPKTVASSPEIKPNVDAGAAAPTTPRNQEGKPAASVEVSASKPASAQVKQTAAVQAPAPAPGTRFIFNKEAFLNEVGTKHPMAYSMLGPGREGVWSQTVQGLRDAEAKGVVKYNEKTGELIVKDMNHPEVQKILQDMKDNELDRNTFMKQQEEKKAAAAPPEKKVETPSQTPAPKQEALQQKASQTQAPAPQKGPEVQPAQQVPKVPGASDGGSFSTPGDVQFYPMDKRDNIAAVDTRTQKPLFTAKGGERIDVTPQQKVRESLGPTGSSIGQEMDALRQEMRTTMASAGSAPQPQGVKISYDAPTSTTFTDDLNKQIARRPYNNPAFERAMMRTRMQEHGDPLNNHFSTDNTNY
jgi:Mannosyl-glycoprotein endo-beta-N-acetylglucosaminidase